MRRRFLLGAACAGLLGGCAAPYQLPASTPVARVHLVNFDRPELCVAGQRFALSPNSKGEVTLAAGRPVHLIGYYARRTGGHCNFAVIFTPKAGQTYDVMNEARAEQCLETVMLHDPAAQYGLRLEPSVSAPEICR